jgi:hypothetical protein
MRQIRRAASASVRSSSTRHCDEDRHSRLEYQAVLCAAGFQISGGHELTRGERLATVQCCHVEQGARNDERRHCLDAEMGEAPRSGDSDGIDVAMQAPVPCLVTRGIDVSSGMLHEEEQAGSGGTRTSRWTGWGIAVPAMERIGIP